MMAARRAGPRARHENVEVVNVVITADERDQVCCHKCNTWKHPDDMRSHLWNNVKVPDKTCKQCHSSYVAEQNALKKENRQEAYQKLVLLFGKLKRSRLSRSQRILTDQINDTLVNLE